MILDSGLLFWATLYTGSPMGFQQGGPDNKRTAAAPWKPSRSMSPGVASDSPNQALWQLS